MSTDTAHLSEVDMLPRSFIYESVQNASGNIIIRSNLCTEGDSRKWLAEYSELTKTSWIVQHGLYEPQRLVFHKKFCCQHAKRNKSSADTKRNTNCLATIDIKIKKINKGTKKNDPFLSKTPPLPAIIILGADHNHQINSCGSLKHLRVSDEVKEIFIDFFEQGLGPAASIRQYENTVLVRHVDSPELLASTRFNPSYNIVKNLFNKWRKNNYGNVTETIDAIKTKIDKYNKEGVTIRVHDESPWAIIVVTPSMKRTQTLQEASEIIFIDSTCSVDSMNSTLTVVLSSSKAGALPLCFLIHQGQTEESYKNAFKLLKSFNSSAFGGNEFPMCFMTDNSLAEKNALKSVWPEARQLLCFFHVAQSEWRWLLSKKNNVNAEIRQKVMNLFLSVMYSATTQELEKHTQILKNNAPLNYWKKTEKFLERASEWVLCMRMGITTRGHQTNNYSEATMRIIKDIILERTKAFNSVALVYYCSTIWESYIKIRILNFAHGRKDKTFLRLNLLEKKIKNFDINRVKKENDHLYQVPSFSSNEVYTVNSRVGMCSCAAGSQGAFCKHQLVVHKYFGELLPNTPRLTTEDKMQLAYLATGEMEHSIFYKELKEVESPVHLGAPETSSSNCSIQDGVLGMQIENNVSETAFIAKKRSLLGEFEKFLEKLPNIGIVNKGIEDIQRNLQRLPNEQNCVDTLLKLKCSLRRRKGGVIKVQPTAISRRRPGVSRGCKKLGSGRPPAAEKRRGKRKHCLSTAITQNVNNAMLHGESH